MVVTVGIGFVRHGQARRSEGARLLSNPICGGNNAIPASLMSYGMTADLLKDVSLTDSTADAGTTTNGFSPPSWKRRSTS